MPDLQGAAQVHAAAVPPHGRAQAVGGVSAGGGGCPGGRLPDGRPRQQLLNNIGHVEVYC